MYVSRCACNVEREGGGVKEHIRVGVDMTSRGGE